MKKTAEYKQALAQAKARHADYLERGEDAVTEDDWDAYKLKHCTPERIAASKMLAAKMGRKIEAKARRREAFRYIVTGIAMLLPNSKHVNIPHQS